jgi:hypothetical protein
MAYTDSGRLLPLTADGQGTDFWHSFAHILYDHGLRPNGHLPFGGRPTRSRYLTILQESVM